MQPDRYSLTAFFFLSLEMALLLQVPLKSNCGRPRDYSDSAYHPDTGMKLFPAGMNVSTGAVQYDQVLDSS